MITITAELEDLIDGTVNIPTIPTVLTAVSYTHLTLPTICSV